MGYVEIDEYGDPVTISPTESDVVALKIASRRWRSQLRLASNPIEVRPLPGGDYSILAKNVAGFVRVGNLSLDIAPKFLNRASAGPAWRAALWRMLAYGYGYDLLGAMASGSFVENDGIADVLADLFLRSASQASIRGYPLGYVFAAERSQFLRGRLDVRRLHAELPFTGRVPVVSTRLSRNIALNRLLKWAALRLSRLVESPHRRRALTVWANQLADVTPRPPRLEHVPSPRRHYPHLEPAVDVAKVLLADQSAGFAQGGLELPGFLWNSDDLFERTARRLFNDAARPNGLAATKRGHRLVAVAEPSGGVRYSSTFPDIDVHAAGAARLIADAKYKVLGRDPSSDDIYQVLAGGRAADVENVALVYPAGGVGVASRRTEPVGPGRPLHLHLVIIGLESFGSAVSLRNLQADLSAWLSAALSGTAPATT